MTVSEVVSMLQNIQHYIAQTPINQCTYCAGCSQTRIPDEECVQCIKAGLRALDLAIEKVKEKL